eukprot:TRINITY_DN7072_c0_g1_i10.p1 TRINITY_DN7072_c0_g1~~TRINITY_DN7072_c0_g1_i10.p1  ORF type:complete len:188 (-),score=17.85 TRINITY_DN7072_c0_g1_i10:128-691(-)
MCIRDRCKSVGICGDLGSDNKMAYTFRNVSDGKCIAVPKTGESTTGSNDSQQQRGAEKSPDVRENMMKQGEQNHNFSKFSEVVMKSDVNLHKVVADSNATTSKIIIKPSSPTSNDDNRMNDKGGIILNAISNSMNPVEVAHHKINSADLNVKDKIVEDVLYLSPRSKSSCLSSNNERKTICLGCILI